MTPRALPLVLLVEDESLILAMLAEDLAADGRSVLTERSAADAIKRLEICAGELVALVVDVDLGTPQLTGFEVARHARRLNPALPVLYTTGRSAEDVAAEGVAGAAHVPKPYSASAVRRALAAMIGGGSAALTAAA